jgi:glycosyltransferase involved in cell wall biosynthesis
MQPIRIVACTLSLGTGNGISRMDQALARGLDREKFRYTCCFTDISHPQTRATAGWHIAVSAAGRFERLCELFADADIVQFNGGFDPVACEAAVASGVPTLVEVMHQCDRGQRSPAIDVTVCVSEAVERVQPFREKTVVVPNGIDTDVFCPPAARPSDKIIFLEVAQRGKVMHFHLDDVADRLLALDPRVEIRLAGSGQDGAPSHGDRVRFLGLCEDMAALYAQAHFLVLASKRDAFGLACAEAMACGCLPLVAADGGMAEIVRHGRTGWLFDGRDRESFYALAGQAVAREAAGELTILRRQSREAILEGFSLRRCLDRYKALYTDCVARNGRRGAARKPAGPRQSAEGLIGETIMGIQAHLDLEALIQLWIDAYNLPLAPLREPDDAYWLVCRSMLRSLFQEIADAGYASLSASLLARLEALYPLEPQAGP